MPDDISDRIDEVAAGPKKASGDLGMVEEQSLEDLIAADKYRAAKAATSGTSPRLLINRIVPPGGA